MATKLTAKEVSIVSDLLTYEEAAIKKAKLYSKTITDQSVSGAFSRIQENHKKRFDDLLNLL